MARSGQPVTGRSSLGRPGIVAPALRSRSPLSHCLRPRSCRSGVLLACRLRLGGLAGGRVLAPRAPGPGHPRAVHRAMHRARQCIARVASPTTSCLPRKPGTGAGVAGSCMSPVAMSVHVPSIRRIDRRRQKPARPESYLGKATTRTSGPHTLSASGRGTLISCHWTKRASACITGPRRRAHRAGHLCQRRRRLQAINRA